MKIFKQVILIAIFSLIGELISFLIRTIIPAIFIPGSLIGMILLFVFLSTKIIKLEMIDSVGNFFVNNMAFFFIPAAVSVMNYFDVLKSNIVKIIIVCFLSFIITFTAIALSVKFTLLIQEKKKKELEKMHE